MRRRRESQRLLFRLSLLATLLLSLVPFSAVPSSVQAAPSNVLTLKVQSARAEPDHPGGAVTKGQAITQYKFLINEDNTGNPAQPREQGCSPADPAYPNNCDWPSMHTTQAYAPVVTQGDNTILNATTGITLPNGKYLISVIADGYKIDGAHFTVPFNNTDPVVVEMQPYPLPLATVRIQVFEDTNVVNGQYDVPGENALSGFEGHIFDILGDVTTDWYGNPICTQYQKNSNGKIILNSDGKPTPIAGTGGKCLSDLNGIVEIPNIGPNRYTATVVPPNGTNWVQTTTLEGNHDFDVWPMEGATGNDTEFTGPNAEPVPDVFFGYVKPQALPANSNVTGEIKGTVMATKTYFPQKGGLVYNGQSYAGGSGTKVDKPISKPWIALNDLRQGDTTVYVGQGNPDGTFDIKNVPDSDYSLAYWDGPQSYLLEMRNVTVANGKMTDMGNLFMAGWWTTLEGRVCIDNNSNGKCEPNEPGIPNQVVNLKSRENTIVERGISSYTTDNTGRYVLANTYPFTAFRIMEVYNDRFYTNGITYQADNDPQEHTVLGQGVDVSYLPIIGLGGRLDWALKPYNPNSPTMNNGGIVGTVSYDTTRNELDASKAAVETYQPGIPGLKVKLYKPVPDTVNGGYLKDTDGSVKKGPQLNEYITEQWERPTGCTYLDVDGNPVVASVIPVGADKPCLEAPLAGTQFQAGFSTVDGNYGFGTVWRLNPDGTPVKDANGNNVEDPIQPGDYLVEVEIPNDSFGRPLFKVTKEEDVNIFTGDQFTPQVPPPGCAGPEHIVDVKGVGNDGPNAVDNPDFADAGGSPYEGQAKNLCNVKFITLQRGRSIAPTFNLFTDVPMPGRYMGYIVDDLNLSTNPQDTLFGEKRGLPNSPIGIYDFSNRLITTIQSDPNGLFEVLLPSTSTYNCPVPAGPCAGMFRLVGNDPGLPGKLNPNYDRQYRTIAANFEIWPGLIMVADLAPTRIATNVLNPGSQFNAPPMCLLSNDTPQLMAVSKPYARTSDNQTNRTITIDGQGFGASQGKGTVTLDSTAMTISSWNDTQIKFIVPTSMATGPHQLNITADNGKSTVNGLTFHFLGTGYNPQVFEVGPGKTYSTIQAAVNAASSRAQALVVVYPGALSQVNPQGAYYENLVIHTPLKLQGVGPGGTRTDSTQVRGSVIDGLGFEQVNAAAWRTLVQSLQWDGNQQVYEGATIYLLARQNQFGSNYKAAIDGLTIQGGDQLGTPTKQNSIPGGGVALTQGGGIFANAYISNLQITNNIIEHNGGAYGGAVRLGTAYVGDNHNDNVRIANNRIRANGGTNLAGAIGLFNGSNNYEIAENDICGNYSAEYGGGISHYGRSTKGSIHDNRIYFNNSYDEGGGIMIAGELPRNPNDLSAGSGPVDIYNNLIQANLSNDDGGGLRFLMAGNFQMNVYNNIVVNNISTHEGGGIALDDAPNVRIINNTIMKNITTATAATSNGQPAPAGLSTAGNSQQLQATLPVGSPTFSKPVLFNNIFWDNRAGSWSGGGVSGIGLQGDPNPIRYWDLGVADGTGTLTPTNSILQATGQTSVVDSATNKVQNPLVKSVYEVGVSILPWRTDPNFIGSAIVAVEAPPDQMGDYHLQDTSPAVDAGVGAVGNVNAPATDYDGDKRPSFSGFEIGADEQPGAPVLDDFNRANTVSGLGSPNWGGQTALPNFRINSNQLQLNSFTQSSIFWNASKFGANQEAFVTLVGNVNNFTGAGVVLKIDGLQANGMAGANTHAIIVTYIGNRQVRVQTLSPNQVFTTRATFTMPTSASLTNAELRAQSLSDGTVRVYWNGSMVGSVNVTSGQGGWNAAYASAPGYIGVVATTNGTRLDDFGGGVTR